jgi:hypothetical protein
MDMDTIISTAAGGLISAIISWIFYRLGGRGLAKEAKRLHDLNVLLLRAFEEAGLARVNRDASGQPIGLVLEGTAVMESASASDACDAEIIRPTAQPSAAVHAATGELSKVDRRSREAAIAMFGPGASDPKE